MTWTSRRALALGTLFGLGATFGQTAEAAEYRVFTLNDGRVLVAEVLATEGTGMRVRVPQGETIVPFTLLADMTPIEQAQYDEQQPWMVYVASDAMYRDGFVSAFAALPSVEVIGQTGAHGPLTAEQIASATACDVDMECLVDALQVEGSSFWVVVAGFEGSEVVYHSAVTSGTTRVETRASRLDPDAVAAKGYEAIGLHSVTLAPTTTVVEVDPDLVDPDEIKPTKPTKPIKPPPTPRVRGAMDRDKVIAMSFIPVPGLASLKQGDTAGFGLAIATVVPTTALWVGATGKNAQSAPQHILLSVGGFYATTVLANQFFGLRSLEQQHVALGVAPTEAGGAAVQFSVALE